MIRIFSWAGTGVPAERRREINSALGAALQRNPHHVDSMLLAIDSRIDAEQYKDVLQIIAEVLAVNPLESRAWAYRSVLAHLNGNATDEMLCREMALAWWPTNPDVDHLIGRKLSQKYRFQEGAGFQRQALAFDAKHLPSKVQLSQDLLRLGDELEGWRLAQEVFDADSYNVVAHNLTTLRDHLAKFRVLTGDGFAVHMDVRGRYLRCTRAPFVESSKRDTAEKIRSHVGQTHPGRDVS